MSWVSLANKMARAEREILVSALQSNYHNVARTAAYLDISEAKCRRLCKKHNLNVAEMRLRRAVQLLEDLAS